MSKNKNYPINPIKEHQIFFELLDNHNKKINLYKNINSDLENYINSRVLTTLVDFQIN